MSPEETKLVNDLMLEVNALNERLDAFNSATTIPLEVGEAFKKRVGVPSALADAPKQPVTSPTGGATIDSAARTAIDTIITRLETLGLIDPN